MKAIHTVARQVLARRTGRSEHEIRAWQHLEQDLGVLPLDLVAVAIAIEERAGAELPVEGLTSVETVGDFFAFLSAALADDERDSVLPRVA